jgi:hypothetical protein
MDPYVLVLFHLLLLLGGQRVCVLFVLFLLLLLLLFLISILGVFGGG